ncbi:hypothetical protein GOBAR_AA25972 [Gossypium barbadense]|uniref:Uncharacterized protein n=1 Tax=Gossypium barbadense TaxID=3634 RepID=A0A2P5WUD4_GOSBA|nr:hypothetical protein GOBAR_AA25972 [Gossypium barbadense]
MNVDAIMESALKPIDDKDTGVYKRVVTSKREPTLLIPSARLKTQAESACTKAIEFSFDLEFKYNSLKIESESRVRQLEDQIKAHEEQHLTDLEKIQKENVRALVQYKVKTNARIMDYLSKLKSNYIHHA